MKHINHYGLPLLTAYGWLIIGRVIIGTGLAGLAALQLGVATP